MTPSAAFCLAEKKGGPEKKEVVAAVKGKGRTTGDWSFDITLGPVSFGISSRPLDDDPGPDERIVDAVTEWVARRLPRIDATPLRAETCVYTNIENERFVCERRGRYVIGSACSGHGFKFAPAVGEILADAL